MSKFIPSIRARILTRRSYNRPLDDAGKVFETWEQTVSRVKKHQRWLWEQALGGSLLWTHEEELEELAQLMLDRKACVSGRTLWLGGTELVKRRQASNFNCAGLIVRTVHDLVDAFWLLLQGCGVGIKPQNGMLSGFTRKMEFQIIRSTRTDRGRENNIETYDSLNKIWTISIGDSAEAWAKSIGKLLAGKFPAKKLIIDLSQIRPAGTRLKGYGWISSGDEPFSIALEGICVILNRQAGKLLSKMDILEIVNWLGTVLSSRRSAEIILMDYGDPEWQTFATAKSPEMLKKHWYRGQSNNTLIFWEKPSQKELQNIFEMMIAHGGSEPGFLNAKAAKKRAPYWETLNPCAEILLSNTSFCNLVEIDLAKFKNDHIGLQRAMWIIARANYRQTLVNLRDGILQDSWHQCNEFLRLCGVGLTGLVRRSDIQPYDLKQLRNIAVYATHAQADELNAEYPKNVTTTKPSGTLSKAIFDTTEGIHRPKGKYLINNIIFSKHDPLVQRLYDANYILIEHPNDKQSLIARFPVAYHDVEFETLNGVEVDRESAVSQLERYKIMQDNYVDHNTSITVSYDKSEVKTIIDWILRNWNSYVATSFLFRVDHTKTAEDIGYPYLPQEVITKDKYEEYVSTLKDVDIDNLGSLDTQLDDDCSTGTCPTR